MRKRSGSRARSARSSSAPAHAFSRFAASPWLMRPEALTALAQSAQAILSGDASAPSRQALSSREGESLVDAWRVSVVDGVATRHIRGPLFHYDERYAWWFGGDTYTSIVRDIRAMMDSSTVRQIVLAFDSPGGEASGCAELAAAIRELDEVKPITAHVSDEACSAAYWLASACREVVGSPTALAGCLGVQMLYYDVSGFYEQIGIREIRIVSSQTPRKNAPPTEATGRNDLQRVADDLAEVFLSRVAEYRGIDEDEVAEQFGAGAVFVGARALEAGMFDQLATADELHEQLLEARAGSISTIRLEADMATKAKASSKGRRADSAAAATDEQETDSTTPDESAGTQDPAAEGSAGAAASAGADTSATASEGEGDVPDSAAGESDGNDDAGEELKDGDEAAEAIASAFPKATASIRAAAAQAERERLAGIAAVALPGHAKLVAECQADPSCTPEQAAARIIAAENAARGRQLGARAADEQGFTPPAPLANGNGVGAEASAAQTVQRIVATHQRLLTPARS